MQILQSTPRLDEWTHPQVHRASLVSTPASYPEDEREIRLSPEWGELELHRRMWADGDAMELRLDFGNEPASRCLVSSDGQFLLGPTGPQWARELVSEAVGEWLAQVGS